MGAPMLAEEIQPTVYIEIQHKYNLFRGPGGLHLKLASFYTIDVIAQIGYIRQVKSL